MLWLMVVVGREVGWWVTIRRQAKETEQAYGLMRYREEELRRSRQLEDLFKRAILKDSN